MGSLFRLQFLCTLFVLVSVLAAEVVALSLSINPRSELLWWLNLEVFRGVGLFLQLADWPFGLSWPGTVLVVSALIGLSVLAYWRAYKMPLAIISNTAAAFSAAMVYFWLVRPDRDVAALNPTALEFRGGWILVLSIVAGSVLAAVASHIVYIREMRSRR